MSEFSLEVRGLDVAISRLGRANVQQIVDSSLAVAGSEMVRIAKETTAFSDRTGRLRSSFAVLQTSPFKVVVGSQVEYAGFLEYGTRFMIERPHWRPSIESVMTSLRRELSDALRRELTP